MSYGSLAAKTVEFEPNFAYNYYTDSWDDNGTLVKSDTSYLASSLSWRFTYGVTDRFEIGMMTNSDFSFVNWAVKLDLFEKNKHQFGIMLGLDNNYGNRQYSTSNPDPDALDTYGIGLIYTWAINEVHSLDANIQYNNYFSTELINSHTIFYSLDYGRYFNENYLVVLAASYQHQDETFHGSKFLFLSPGVSMEHSEKYQIAINANYPILGSNAPKAWGYNIALTLCLE